MQITINEDTTFFISDDLGNIPPGLELGLYNEDTRFVSRYELTLDGQEPLLLTAQQSGHASALHYLTNPALPGVRRGTLSVVRRRAITGKLREEITVTNHGDRPAAFALELRLDADFADIFEVKAKVEVARAAVSDHGTRGRSFSEGGKRLLFSYSLRDYHRSLAVVFSETPSRVANGHCTFALQLAPRQTWTLGIDFLTLCCDEAPGADAVVDLPRQDADRVRLEERRANLVLEAPALATDSYVLARAYEQSVHDFAALRIMGENLSAGSYIIAAGIPWFMALFGRDSLLASFQALPFYPEAAKGTLRALARLQGTQVDKHRAEEPGKILHEYRFGLVGSVHKDMFEFPYYGSIDSTPLFLLLLAAVCRVTGDYSLARELREPALRALEWMDRYGDRDGDGYLEYICEAERGLENQGWKDSWDAIRFRDGAIARAPIALCEAQGYAYAAWRAMAEVFDHLREKQLAAQLREHATRLKARFNRDFWMPERGYYALALDADKRQVDAITSNPGHLLWTGIADEEKARQVADVLLSPVMFSGWGIRTMATTEGGYNPISYHCGSVWPHDNSLIISGLARYGFTGHAAKVTSGLVAALGNYSDFRLPELFAGYSVSEAPFPVEYPTASRPQAWASGSVFLLLTAMLGIDAASRTLRGHPFLPPDVARVRLEHLWAGIHQRSLGVEAPPRISFARLMRRRIRSTNGAWRF